MLPSSQSCCPVKKTVIACQSRNFPAITVMRLSMYIIISILGWFVVTTFAIGQEEELALIEEVESLQRQLASADVLQRDQAETGLLKLGPQILDYLDPPDEDASTDYRERILRLRTQLEKDVVSLTAQPTTVTFRGEMTLMHAL